MRTLAFALLLLLPQEEEKINREVLLANTGALALQGQAIDRLRHRGAEAAPHIVAFVKTRGHNALSQACTDLLGAIHDPSIAALCAELIEDRDFYWRGSAALSLAELKSKTHLPLQRKNLGDRLWAVRAGGILAMELLEDKCELESIRKALNDDTYYVRSQAAKTLRHFGDDAGLPVLVESLRSNVKWFDIDYGQIAREDACKFLAKITGGDFGFKAWETVAERAPGLKKWQEWMDGLQPGWNGKLPPNARVTEDTAEYAFGFELRSCRTGDFFFRLDTKGNLVLGYFNLSSAALTADERARLEKAIESVGKVDRRAPYGDPGCDFEQYYVRSPKEGFDKLWIGVRGRPAQLDGFIKTVGDLMKEKFGEGAGKEFRQSASIFRETD